MGGGTLGSHDLSFQYYQNTIHITYALHIPYVYTTFISYIDISGTLLQTSQLTYPLRKRNQHQKDIKQSKNKANQLTFQHKSSTVEHHFRSLFTDFINRIHGTGIFTYIYHTNQPNVGRYTIHGSVMGNILYFTSDIQKHRYALELLLDLTFS